MTAPRIFTPEYYARMRDLEADDPVNAFRRYEPADLRAKLKDTGFAIHRMGRLNALLGLAEIPRELRAHRSEASGYHGLMAETGPDAPWLFALKRAWLDWEGRLMAHGVSFPFGRAILALCQVPLPQGPR